MFPANGLSYFQNYCIPGRFREQTRKLLNYYWGVGGGAQENL